MSSKRKLDCSNAQPKKKTRRSTSDLKLGVLKSCDSNLRNRNLRRRRHHIRAGAVNFVLKDKKKKCTKVAGDVKAKKSTSIGIERKALIAEMETVLVPWITAETQRLGQPLRKKAISKKALDIFAGLKKKCGQKPKSLSFCASKAWYRKFMQTVTQSSGKEEEATEKKLIKNFIQLTKNEGYTSQQIFTFSQTILYWKQFPIAASPFLSDEEKNMIRKKGNKKRMILLLGANVFGDFKLKPLAVYPSENPNVFTGIRKSDLPVIWQYQVHSLITSNIFEKWFTFHFIPELELYCQENMLQCKALIVLDSSITFSEKLLSDYPNIKILSLPSPTNTLFQHMHLTIIKSFRENYAHKISVRMLQYVSEEKKRGKKDFWKIFNIKDAVEIIGESWHELSKHYLNLVWKKRYPELFGRDKQSNDFYFLISWKMFKLINCFSALHLEESLLNSDDCSGTTSVNIGHFLDCVIQEDD